MHAPNGPYMGQERSDAPPHAKTTECQFVDMVMTYQTMNSIGWVNNVLSSRVIYV